MMNLTIVVTVLSKKVVDELPPDSGVPAIPNEGDLVIRAALIGGGTKEDVWDRNCKAVHSNPAPAHLLSTTLGMVMHEVTELIDPKLSLLHE